MSFRINKLSKNTAMLLFYLYAVLMGLTLSSIFIRYELGMIYAALGMTSGMFAVMATYGATTKRDLSSMGSIFIMLLVGLIIATVVNLMLRSELMEFIICYASIVVFVGLTAYDTQKVKNMLQNAISEQNEYNMYDENNSPVEKVAIIGALILYFDFVNLFLNVLKALSRASRD